MQGQQRVVLAIDGLQPDVGHEVLWVLRDCLSGEVLLAKSLLSATIADLMALLAEVRDSLPVPLTAVVSDGQQTIRKAVAGALPGVPHQLCHFHYLREAARPIYEADRHAKKELKKRVRGVRALERAGWERRSCPGTKGKRAASASGPSVKVPRSSGGRIVTTIPSAKSSPGTSILPLTILPVVTRMG